MTFAGLALRNLRRNPARAALTSVALVVTTFAFLLLQTLVTSYEDGTRNASPGRLITHHSATPIMPLPRSYVDRVRQVPGVQSVTYMRWFGGVVPSQPDELFTSWAVDETTFFDVTSDYRIPQDQLEAWKQKRTGAVIGAGLAKKFGWKPGDKVVLEADTFAEHGPWDFEISGIFRPKPGSQDDTALLLHYAYLNDTLGGERRDEIASIMSRIEPGARSSVVGAEIDKVFANREPQTLSEDENMLQASMMGSVSAVLGALDFVSVVILGIMGLILANTIAMGVRERTNEYGALRALGFRASHVSGFIVGEALFLVLLGGVVGVGLSFLVIDRALARPMVEVSGGIFPTFGIAARSVVAVLAGLLAIGGLGGAIPALRVSRVGIVEALRDAS